MHFQRTKEAYPIVFLKSKPSIKDNNFVTNLVLFLIVPLFILLLVMKHTLRTNGSCIFMVGGRPFQVSKLYQTSEIV
jgi:hypothetical protein